MFFLFSCILIIFCHLKATFLFVFSIFRSIFVEKMDVLKKIYDHFL